MRGPHLRLEQVASGETPEVTDVAVPGRKLAICALLNPASGNVHDELVRAALGRAFEGSPHQLRIVTLHDASDAQPRAHRAAIEGADVVVAAGGDGTVSAVANGVLGTRASLGILPLGTANVLASELGIPLDLDAACQLLAAATHEVRVIDVMRVGDRHFLTQIGVGLDALTMRDTSSAAKQRFGRIAYLWVGIRHLIGFQTHRFHLVIDGRERRVTRASQVLIANVGVMGQQPFRWGPGIRPDDGQLEACVVRARTLLDYLGLGWHVLSRHTERSLNIRYHVVRQEIRVESPTAAANASLPVQADGEAIGQAPVHVVIVPKALRVIAPPSG